MTIPILISGATGAMGQMVFLAAQHPQWEVNVIGGFAESTELAHLESHDLKFPLFTYQEISDSIVKNAKCIVDFSNAKAVPELLEFATSNRIPLVLCTTGLDKDLQSRVVDASKVIPIFQSGNMSYGINLLEYVLKQIAPRLHPHFDIEIVEKHHRRKVDAPSGTALMLANAMLDAIPDLRVQTGRSGYECKRQPNDLTIHAVRGGTNVGEHQVLFAGNHETLTLTHQAESREVFAQGALRAVHFLANKPAGLYNMHNLITEESINGNF